MMNDQEAERLRNAIMRHQTACRCGHLLAACADCRDWLSQHSPRIAHEWQWWVKCWGTTGLVWSLGMFQRIVNANTAEADDLAYFKSLQ